MEESPLKNEIKLKEHAAQYQYCLKLRLKQNNAAKFDDDDSYDSCTSL